MRRRNNFAEELRMKRKQVKLSQRELGVLVGVSGATIGHYETGETFPRVDTMKKLEAVLGGFEFDKEPKKEPKEVKEPTEAVIESEPITTHETMNALTFLNEYKRFCEYHKQLKCHNCPLNSNNNGLRKNGKFLYCTDLIKYYPIESIEIIGEWGKSNPQKEYKVVITETKLQECKIVANSKEEALKIANSNYRSGVLIVDDDDKLEYTDMEVLEA